MSTPSSAVEFRCFEPRDESALAGLFSANDVPEVTCHFHPFALRPESATRICATTSRDRFYGVWAGDRLVALAMLRGWEEGHRVPSLGLLVDRDRQGQGIGGQIIDFLIGEARRLGSARLRSTAHADNAAVLRLHKARGFVVTDRADNRLVMELELR